MYGVRATTRIYYVVPRNYFYCIRCYYYHSSNLLWASLRIFPSKWNLNLHWKYFTSMLKKSDKRLIVYLCDWSHRKLHAAHLVRRSLGFSTKIIWGWIFLLKLLESSYSTSLILTLTGLLSPFQHVFAIIYKFAKQILFKADLFFHNILLFNFLCCIIMLEIC